MHDMLDILRTGTCIFPYRQRVYLLILAIMFGWCPHVSRISYHDVSLPGRLISADRRTVVPRICRIIPVDTVLTQDENPS